jgi:hypothetical protein
MVLRKWHSAAEHHDMNINNPVRQWIVVVVCRYRRGCPLFLYEWKNVPTRLYGKP